MIEVTLVCDVCAFKEIIASQSGIIVFLGKCSFYPNLVLGQPQSLRGPSDGPASPSWAVSVAGSCLYVT